MKATRRDLLKGGALAGARRIGRLQDSGYCDAACEHSTPENISRLGEASEADWQ